ncbi:MAG: DUF3040 domain-containing protein [Microbacteriaceae bacterium]|nr:DUF3040 domain-containing protein [Microbacteriaceae bacterium]MCL2794960.1 DUF3040 domain-containing protein [Microbacteriaceae bacterium]
MPLSEHEQRLLDEMERNLYQNDADFVANISQAPRHKPAYRAIVLGVLIAVVGVAALILGVSIRQPLVGIVGFLLMFAGVMVTITPGRRGHEGSFDVPSGPAASSGAGRGPQKGASDFMGRMNERWEKRQDGEH